VEIREVGSGEGGRYVGKSATREESSDGRSSWKRRKGTRRESTGKVIGGVNEGL